MTQESPKNTRNLSFLLFFLKAPKGADIKILSHWVPACAHRLELPSLNQIVLPGVTGSFQAHKKSTTCYEVQLTMTRKKSRTYSVTMANSGFISRLIPGLKLCLAAGIRDPPGVAAIWAIPGTTAEGGTRYNASKYSGISHYRRPVRKRRAGFFGSPSKGLIYIHHAGQAKPPYVRVIYD